MGRLRSKSYFEKRSKKMARRRKQQELEMMKEIEDQVDMCLELEESPLTEKLDFSSLYPSILPESCFSSLTDSRLETTLLIGNPAREAAFMETYRSIMEARDNLRTQLTPPNKA